MISFPTNPSRIVIATIRDVLRGADEPDDGAAFRRARELVLNITIGGSG